MLNFVANAENSSIKPQSSVSCLILEYICHYSSVEADISLIYT